MTRTPARFLILIVALGLLLPSLNARSPEPAQAKIKIALSTGSRDRLIREHASAIARASSESSR